MPQHYQKIDTLIQSLPYYWVESILWYTGTYKFVKNTNYPTLLLEYMCTYIWRPASLSTDTTTAVQSSDAEANRQGLQKKEKELRSKMEDRAKL